MNSTGDHLKKDAPEPKKRTIGTADTDTAGRNAKRYKYVRDCILKKMVNPSINAVRSIAYGGVKMGDKTARAYLDKMAEEGILKKMMDGQGRRCFELVKT